MEEGRTAFKILTDKPTGKRPLRRFMDGWEDNIKIDFKEIGVNTRNGLLRLMIGVNDGSL